MKLAGYDRADVFKAVQIYNAVADAELKLILENMQSHFTRDGELTEDQLDSIFQGCQQVTNIIMLRSIGLEMRRACF